MHLSPRTRSLGGWGVGALALVGKRQCTLPTGVTARSHAPYIMQPAGAALSEAPLRGPRAAARARRAAEEAKSGVEDGVDDRMDRVRRAECERVIANR